MSSAGVHKGTRGELGTNIFYLHLGRTTNGTGIPRADWKAGRTCHL